MREGRIADVAEDDHRARGALRIVAEGIQDAAVRGVEVGEGGEVARGRAEEEGGIDGC